MVYAWKPGTRYKVDANKAGAVCEQLEAEGRLTAKDLLEASRPADAPLHNEFEWDDSVAAEKFRESQAGGIIRSLVVEMVPEKPPVRKFCRVTQAPETGYTKIETVLTRDDLRKSLLIQAQKDFESYKAKYDSLSELSALFATGNQIFTAPT